MSQQKKSTFIVTNERWQQTLSSGFTLLETVIVVAISSIAMLALVNLFFTFNSIYGYQQTFIATAGSASSSMNAFETYVTQADQVLAAHSFSGTTYTSTTTSLVLELPSVDSSGNTVTAAKDYVVLYASSTQLYVLVAADAQSTRTSGRKTLSGTLSSLTLTYSNANFTQVTNVSVDMLTRGTYKNQTIQSRLTEQLYLRNFSL
jgi:prepilin-type N-terminal cleavage/methylation domain-containing protein